MSRTSLFLGLSILGVLLVLFVEALMLKHPLPLQILTGLVLGLQIFSLGREMAAERGGNPRA